MRTNEYRYTLATILQSSGKTAEAIPLFEEVLNNDIGFYMAHVRLANIYEMERDYARAAKARQSAVDANPDDASLVTDLGVTLGKAGDFAGAESRLQQAYDANPRDVRPLFWLGIARIQLGKPVEAREAFEQFIRLAPTRYDRQIAMAKERLAQLP
jgi:Flp pilus assembly protein TadD